METDAPTLWAGKGFPKGFVCDSMSLRQKRKNRMGKAHPVERSERAIAFAADGMARQAAGSPRARTCPAQAGQSAIPDRAPSSTEKVPQTRHADVGFRGQDEGMADSVPALIRHIVRTEPHPLVRVLVITAAAGLSGCLFYSHVPLQVGPLALWQLAGLLYAGMVGVSTGFIFAFLPKLRQFVEFTAMSRLGLALAATWHPEAAVRLLASPMLNATLVVGIAILLRYALRARPWLRTRLAQRLGPVRTAQG